MRSVSKGLPADVTHNERRQRILDTLRNLASRRGELTLDEIDGEFWWRCCQLDFVADAAALRAVPLLNRNDGDEPVDRLDALLRMARKYGLPLSAIAAQLEDDSPIAVREPALALHHRHDDRDEETVDRDIARRQEELGLLLQPPCIVYANVIDRLSVKVPTPTMDGDAVAQRIGRFLSAHERAGQFHCHPRDRSAFAVHLDVDLVTEDADESDESDVHWVVWWAHLAGGEPRPTFFASFGTIPPPYIRLAVGYPWPPAEFTAAVYDAALARHPEWVHAWGEAAATARAQTPEVAIRTWAVSLLMAAGVPHDEAMQQVCAVCQLERISRPGWSTQRKLLLQRVPQATRYLYESKYLPTA